MANDSAGNSGSYRCLHILTALFTAVLVCSNIASSAKIVGFKFSVFGMNLAFDGGTLIFPLAYVIGSLLTEVYGYAVARRVVWTGFIVLAISAVFFFVLRALPGETLWEDYAGSTAYESILGGMSSGGIVAASLLAYIAGSFLNPIIHSFMKILSKGRFLWLRSITSSAVGELVDSLVFVSVASITGIFPFELFGTLVFTIYIMKMLIEWMMIPLVYLSSRVLKKAEGLDAYDKGVRYNPFKL